jgi:hypothetical protein
VAQSDGEVNEFDQNPILWLMTEYRGAINLIVVLPLSFLMESYNIYRDWFYRTFNAAPLLHDERVKAVQKQVAAASEIIASDSCKALAPSRFASGTQLDCEARKRCALLARSG